MYLSFPKYTNIPPLSCPQKVQLVEFQLIYQFLTFTNWNSPYSIKTLLHTKTNNTQKICKSRESPIWKCYLHECNKLIAFDQTFQSTVHTMQPQRSPGPAWTLDKTMCHMFYLWCITVVSLVVYLTWDVPSMAINRLFLCKTKQYIGCVKILMEGLDVYFLLLDE